EPQKSLRCRCEVWRNARGCCSSALACRFGRSRFGEALGRRSRQGRQLNAEKRSTLGAILADDSAVVFLNDAVTDAQAESRSLANSLGRVERIEYPLRVPRSGSIIGELQDDAGAVLTSANP